MKFSALSLIAATLISDTRAFAPTATSSSSSNRHSISSAAASATITALEATRKPFISGNWKLNPQTRQEAIDLAKGIASAVTSDSPDADVALFVPYVFLETAMEAVDGKIDIGAEVRTVNKSVIGFFFLSFVVVVVGCFVN